MQPGPEKLSSEQSPGSKRGPSARSSQPLVISAGGSRRQGAMALSFLLAAGLISAPLFAASAPSATAVVTDISPPGAETEFAGSLTQAPVKLESPDGDCFEWKYPKKAECGSLSGKTECKAEPSINTLEKDEAKRAACKPEEGAECFCGEDDDDDDDDDE